MTDRQQTRAVVRYDPRSFFVRALGAALDARWLDAIDVDRMEMDIVNMAFRYHARMRWDVRNYETVQIATEIVIRFVDDGLQIVSGGDVDRAAWFLAGSPLTDCFRASWGEVEANRRALAEIVRASRVVFGYDVTRVIASAVPKWSVNPDPTELRSYADTDLLEAMRNGVPLARWREYLRVQVARARECQLVFSLLPMDEVRARWSLFGEIYTLLPDEELDVSLFGWLGACIRVCTRGDLGVVVRVRDIEQFLCERVERARIRGRLADGMAPTITEAIERIAALLDVRDDARFCTGIRHALEDAIDHLGATIANTGARRGAKNFPAWVHWWQQTVFLDLTDAEYERAIGDEHALALDEIIVRLQHPGTREHRLALVAAIDFAEAPPDALVACFASASDLAEEICTRVDWDALEVSTLRALAVGSLSLSTMRVIARALVTRRVSLRDLPTDIVYDCLLAFADDQRDGPALRQRLAVGWEKAQREFLAVFRAAETDEERVWWVQLALELPEHFAYIVSDALPRERACIERVLAQDDGVPRLAPETVVRAFRWMEERARTSGRRSRKTPASLVIDHETRAIWTHLAPELRSAVRASRKNTRRAATTKRRRKKA